MSSPAADTNENIIAYLEHMCDWMYESLGPANDDIIAMAQEDWRGMGNEVPTAYDPGK